MKSERKDFNKKDLFVVLILVALVIGVILVIFNTTNRPEQFTYKDLVERVENGDVKTIVATPVGSGGNSKLYAIDGKYQKVDESGKSIDVTFQIIVDDEVISYLKEKMQEQLATTGKTFDLEFKKLVVVDWVSILTVVILPIGLIAVLIFMMKNAGGSNKQAFDFAKSRAKLNRKATTTFKDIAGADEEKEEMEEIIDFLKNPQKYYEIGARIPKGILLVGPPGTGKTLMARAVAGEAKVPFYSISGSDFVEMFVGVGASRVRDMFKTAKQNAPCIVFIDEIDAVGRQRGAGLGGGHDEREQTLNQLLVEMDGFGDNSGIIIMAATNRPDVLDPALLRPGRFDRQITMSNPDVKARVEILKVHARNKKLSPKINLDDISRRTPGFSGADLENLLNEAALLAARENRKEIKIYDIDEAIDRVMMGPAKRSRKYSDEEKKSVSYHESGHAIIGVKLDNAETVQKVTIVPRGQAGGYAMMTPDKESFLQTKSQLLDTITGLLGGRVSEELFIGDISTGAHNDFQQATAIARAMVTEYGMSKLGPVQYEKESGSVFLGRDYMKDKNFSDQVALEIDNEVRNIIDECYQKAKQVLTDNSDLVHLIAKHLMEIETLTKEDIYELVNTGRLEWWEKKKAKEEAERIAKEKEQELQDIYRKQLEAMEKVKNESQTNNNGENK
ncbi:MAG: ATP-dependent zinc metalloprotease FtsH [Bacilli bacterium]|nr:ATP-dependent zinc metalloprotease FtsH [Acholeplasmataceae bacterium]MDY2903010.1 ATP-dependent zinc metalloprotease FtsH [Bacilli bacterium]